MINLAKSAAAIAALIALLNAIDFGRADVEKFKHKIISMLKNPGNITEQQLQDVVREQAAELQRQAEESREQARQAAAGPAPEKRKQREGGTVKKSEFYSSGDWNAREFYK